jgi:bacterioferritin
MTRNADTVAHLQRALAMELGAVNQYLLHAHTLDDWGLDKLATKMKSEMQEELGHAGQFIDRLIFLGADPVLEPIKTPKKAANLRAMFEADLADEKDAIAFYTEAAETAGAGDVGSRKLFEDTVLDEEGHMDWLQRQLDLLERMGESAFIAKHMSEPGTAES